MPMPWSDTASTKPLADTAPETTTAVSGGENDVAFSSSSARRCATSDDRAARHRELVVDPDELDAGEVGDLGRRGAHDVDERDRLLPLAGLLGARQHEQALRVAAHAGGHVVELEQRVERSRVVLVALEVVEQLELALQQALVAAGEVHEEVAHALAQQLRLLLRDLERHRLDVVERLGELADLVLGLHLDARGLDRADVATGAQRLDQRRELTLRHLAGGSGERADRSDHGPGHEPDQEQREEHGEHGEPAVDAHLAQGGAGVGARGGVDDASRPRRSPGRACGSHARSRRSTRPASAWPRGRPPAAPSPPRACPTHLGERGELLGRAVLRNVARYCSLRRLRTDPLAEVLGVPLASTAM